MAALDAAGRGARIAVEREICIDAKSERAGGRARAHHAIMHSTF